MSLGRLRRSSRFVAALLLFVSAFGLPHRSGADDSCVPFGVEEHNESNHVFKAVTNASDDEHCAICHWTRWLKPDCSGRADGIQIAVAGDEFAASTSWVQRDPSEDHLPPRAPPGVAHDTTRMAQPS